MTKPQLLTNELVERFGERLAMLGAPAATAAEPGLPPDEAQTLVAPLNISLPLEARNWWGWRNGVSPASGRAAMMLSRWEWLSLADAVAECKVLRAMAREVEELPYEQIWADGWLPVCREKGSVVLDTAVRDDGPCPVRIWWPDAPDAPPVLPSMGELVLLWIEAIDSGVWSYDRAGDNWILDDAHLNRWAAVKFGAI